MFAKERGHVGSNQRCDRGSELGTHNRAVESYTAAVEELNEMGVHVNNAGEFPVFSLGVN
jgi:hypothetical protein